MSKIAEQVERLREQIRDHDHRYYVLAQPAISDTQYDQLLRKLQKLEEAHPELHSSDSPTQRVGGVPLDEFERVTHAVPMLSVDNTYNEDELRKFDDRVKKGLGDAPYRYIVDPKIDGVAASLRFEAGHLTLVATRGDGEKGDDITLNARTIRAIPLTLRPSTKTQGAAGFSPRDSALPNVLEIRGEIFWPLKAFEKFNKKREAAGEPTLANPRNATTGTLKQLDPQGIAGRGLSFLAHGLGEIVGVEFETQSALFEQLKDWGVPVSPHARTHDSIDGVLDMVHEWNVKRHELDYLTDGLVVKVDSLAQRETLGATSRYPRWCIAYKFAAEQAETVLNDVTFQVGKLGTITPVAELEPVLLAGTTVKRATLHNFDQVERLDIHIGDTVVVEKAGEVIPKVKEVVLRKRPPSAKPVRPPTSCPVCAEALDWEPIRSGYRAFRCENSECGEYLKRKQVKTVPSECRKCSYPVEGLDHMVNLLCGNLKCAAQLTARIRHFASRDNMDIAGLGEVRIEKFVELDFLKSIPDIYDLNQRHATALREVKRLGEKSLQRLFDGIEASKSRGLARVLSGLGIQRIGVRVAEILADQFQSIDELMAASEADIRNALRLSERQAKKSPLRMAAKLFRFFGNPAGIRAVGQLPKDLPLLEQFVHLQIPGFRAEKILSNRVPLLEKTFGDIVALSKATKDEIAEALEDEKIIAAGVYDFFHRRGGAHIIEALVAVGVRLSQPLKQATGDLHLSGQSVVVTGTLENYGRKEIQELIKELGGRVVGSVSKNTDFVVYGASPGSKLEKARSLGVETIDEQGFLKRIGR